MFFSVLHWRIFNHSPTIDVYCCSHSHCQSKHINYHSLIRIANSLSTHPYKYRIIFEIIKKLATYIQSTIWNCVYNFSLVFFLPICAQISQSMCAHSHCWQSTILIYAGEPLNNLYVGHRGHFLLLYIAFLTCNANMVAFSTTTLLTLLYAIFLRFIFVW